MSEHRLRKTYQFVAVNARFLLKALFQPNADLRSEAIMLRVNRCAYHRRKPRINQSLAAYHYKDTLFARVAASRFLHQVSMAEDASSAYPAICRVAFTYRQICYTR
jgi:hypothetical protein